MSAPLDTGARVRVRDDVAVAYEHGGKIGTVLGTAVDDVDGRPARFYLVALPTGDAWLNDYEIVPDDAPCAHDGRMSAGVCAMCGATVMPENPERARRTLDGGPRQSPERRAMSRRHPGPGLAPRPSRASVARLIRHAIARAYVSAGDPIGAAAWLRGYRRGRFLRLAERRP